MFRRFFPHQTRAFNYAWHTQHPALIMEMRTGKTLVTVRRCLTYHPIHTPGLKVLIVAPNSALGSWVDELTAEGIPSNLIIWLRGSRKQRLDLLAQSATWYLINPEGHRALPEIANILWDAVVADESATWMRNPKAQVTRFFLRNFRSVPHRWILAGIANPESDLDLWCQLAFLDTRAFGFSNYWQFRTALFQLNGYDWTLTREGKVTIQKHFGKRCFILRRSDAGIDRQKIFQRRTLELPTALRKVYDKAEADFILKYNDVEIARTFFTVAAFSWLRQICGGFISDKHVWSGKCDELLTLLTGELSKQQVVVWFNFNRELTHTTDYLRSNKINAVSMQGTTPLSQRETIRKEFNAGKIQVLCIQQAIAQTGMNLSAADTAIYYSTPTGLLGRKQTEDRILNLKKSSVLLYLDLIVTDTVDADLYHALKVKKLRSEFTVLQALKVAMHERQSTVAGKVR